MREKIPSTRGERRDPLERARGIGVNTSDGKGGSVTKMPKRVQSVHGDPPAGLDKQERGIWFFEGWGSVEKRTGVLWHREYHRKLKADATVADTDREERPGVDVTPVSYKPMREMPWGLRGTIVRMVESSRVEQETAENRRYRIVKGADGKGRRVAVQKMHDVHSVPASR